MGISALNAALSGLRVSQQQIDTISTNVANVGTPGFSRKILPQNSQASQGVTIGVNSGIVIRNVDLNLERDLWTQISAVGALDVKENYLSRIEQFHGPPDRELSVASDLSRLRDSFVALSDNPEDAIRRTGVINDAVRLADKVNDLADLILSSRNDAQDDIISDVARANGFLEQIADINRQIRENTGASRTTAALEDERDETIKALSEIIEVSFFQRGDGVLVVQTNRGVELATERAQQLSFSPLPLGASSAYPDNAAGIFVGDPITQPTSAIDITEPGPGGRLGGLLELRDSIFPQQAAQLDELAHKIAIRFEAQGLRLFTDASGIIPADTAPTPAVTVPTPAAAIPVEYVGFAAQFQVNTDIIADNSILRDGTAATDTPIQTGSNEVIRRILDFTFSDTAFQQATGTTDVRVAGAATSLQDWLGVFSENRVTTSRDIAALGDLTAAAGSPFTTPGADTFAIVIDPAGEGIGPVGGFNVNINALPAPADANELANTISALHPDITASVNANGQLDITSRWDLQIADVNMGTTGFQFLGINPGTYEATDPHFDIQVGNGNPVRITIEPGDTETELVDKLILDPSIANDTGVAGLALDNVTFTASGQLILRPGDDFTNPAFGGDISITSGAFTVDSANAEINTITPGTLPDGINLVSALFGSFNAAGQDLSPISSSGYQSETETGSGIFVPFRESLLGPDLSNITQITGVSGLIDFAQKMVNQQTQSLAAVQDRAVDEGTLRDVLQQQLLDESGVNIDEELGNLIVIQTAYSAAARVLTAVDELFQELLNAVR